MSDAPAVAQPAELDAAFEERRRPGRLAYRVHEVGDMLDLEHHTVRKLISSGELRAFRVGRSIRVPADEIHRLLGSSLSAPA